MIRRRYLRGLGAFQLLTSGYPTSAVPVGAIWGVQITGATPNAPVTITQQGQTYFSGQPQTLAMGQTDAQGNFTYSGTLADNSIQLGLWNSTWYVAGQPVGSYTMTVVAPGQPASQAQAGSPALSFSNLTTNNPSSFAPGDQWQLTITGAAPAAAVSVYGGRGTNVSAAMGQTDSTGAFSLSGSYAAGDAGQWFERWFVAGVQIGSDLSFVVNQAAASTAPAETAVSDTPVGNAVISTLPASVQPAAQQIAAAASAIPLWGWGVMGIAAAWAFGGKKR